MNASGQDGGVHMRSFKDYQSEKDRIGQDEEITLTRDNFKLFGF